MQVQDTGGLTNTAALTITLSAVIDPIVDEDPTEDPVDPPIVDSGVDPVPEPEVEDPSDPVAEESPSERPHDRVTLSLTGVAHEDSAVESQLREHDSDTPTDAGAADELSRLSLLQEQAMWDGLFMLGDQISEDEARQQAEADQTTARVERMALGVSSAVLALLARASSLTAMALTSLPVWLRVDPLSVLLLSDRDRKKREQELRDAEILEDQRDHLGDLLEGRAEPDRDQSEKDPETDDEEIDS